MSKNKKQFVYTTKHTLRNLNILITVLTFILNIIAFAFLKNNKSEFIIASVFIDIYLIFLYSFLFQKKVKNNLIDIKKECLYINYPANIATFFLCILLVLFISAITLYTVNQDAFIAAFVLMFFVSIISMIMPSIILLALIFFIIPAFIVPGIQITRQNDEFAKKLFTVLFIFFVIFNIYKLIMHEIKAENIISQSIYHIDTIPIQYSTKFLKLEDISPYGKKKLSKSRVSVPFVYTVDTFPFTEYEEANIFCKSLNARMPNYLEMYNIAFNKFDTFGENYYWTSNKDGKTPIVIHFKNMSYKVERYNEKTKPLLYCVANNYDIDNAQNMVYFVRNIKKEAKDSMKFMEEQNFDDKSLLNILNRDLKKEQTERENSDNNINLEKKHVNFSVKEVNSQTLKYLIQKGYNYDMGLRINKEYEVRDAEFNRRITKDPARKQIRLCYYPFTDYGTMSLNEEAQIWSKSFCSPSFELIEQYPALKTKSQKDSYCSSLGGRVPNIPELYGILKTFSINNTGIKYWTNINVKNSNGFSYPVTVYNKDSRFMKAEITSTNEQAYTYCIKNSRNPSKVIANYKSRFKGIDGSQYARSICPNCHYYELPDTILQSY